MWKKYKDFNIEVNENGEIRNYETKRLRKLTVAPNGYLVICAKSNEKQYTLYVHKIVGELFIENPNNYPCINHIDNNRKNPKMENLEWCTFSHNSYSAFHTQGAFKKFTCKKCGKELFDLGKTTDMCCHCKSKEKYLKNRKEVIKNIKLERKQILNKIKNIPETYYYYLIHKEILDSWAIHKSQQEIAQKEKCSRQNISQIISRALTLYYSYKAI